MEQNRLKTEENVSSREQQGQNNHTFLTDEFSDDDMLYDFHEFKESIHTIEEDNHSNSSTQVTMYDYDNDLTENAKEKYFDTFDFQGIIFPDLSNNEYLEEVSMSEIEKEAQRLGFYDIEKPVSDKKNFSSFLNKNKNVKEGEVANIDKNHRSSSVDKNFTGKLQSQQKCQRRNSL